MKTHWLTGLSHELLATRLTDQLASSSSHHDVTSDVKSGDNTVPSTSKGQEARGSNLPRMIQVSSVEDENDDPADLCGDLPQKDRKCPDDDKRIGSGRKLDRPTSSQTAGSHEMPGEILECYATDPQGTLISS